MAKLKSDLLRIALQAPKAAGEALRETGADIASVTKQLVPVDTGALQRSYKSEPVSDELVVVGSDLPYAPYVEFGTSKQSAQPSLVPAFSQAEKTFQTRLAQKMKGLS